MLPQVVVGTNGSAASRHAVRWAAGVAQRIGATLRIVLVVEQAEWWQVFDDTSPVLVRAQRAVAADAPGLATQTVLVAGDPVAQLLGAASSATMLVVGTDHDGRRMPAASFGTIPARVAAAASCPVAVIPHASVELHGVVAGIDDDVQAPAVLAVAMDAALWDRSRLTVVHAATPAPAVDGEHVPTVEGTPILALKRMTEIVTRAFDGRRHSSELEPRVELLAGDAVQVLIRATEGAALLVVGTHGRSALATPILGSVCRALLSQASCPLLVVPRGSASPRLGIVADVSAIAQRSP